jgi:cellulose synthase/poly-beta-1,6-N-acetylglucosamine synthase-like glycosyltransferase
LVCSSSLILVPAIIPSPIFLLIVISLFFPPFDIYAVIKSAGVTFTALTEIIGKICLSVIEHFWICLPVGIVVVWTGAVWLFRCIYAQPYSPLEPKVPYYNSTMGIITAVYNENPTIFKAGLYSWQANNPDELIAVIDQSDRPCIETFIEFSKDKPWARLIVTSKRGKRAALADGILESKSNIVALVDSDTIWADNIRQKLLAPFMETEIGAVTLRIHPLGRDSIWQKMSDIILDIRNFCVLPSQTTMGKTLYCLSGITSLYRREIIRPKLNEFLNEVILGRRKESGDDACLTRIIQREGWKTYYQSNAEVYSSAPLNFKTFLRQRVRWDRNTHNSNIVSLLDARTWKQPYVAFYTVDSLIVTFAILIGPILVGAAVYLNYWNIVLLILILWISDRTIKTIPHIKRQPKDIFILPIYIAITFLIVFASIYAFMTLRKQRWIRSR